MKTMCYNLGKCEVAINGLSVQVSYCRDDTDSEWTRGEAQLITEDEVMEIGFLYSMLTPNWLPFSIRQPRKQMKNTMQSLCMLCWRMDIRCMTTILMII